MLGSETSAWSRGNLGRCPQRWHCHNGAGRHCEIVTRRAIDDVLRYREYGPASRRYSVLTPTWSEARYACQKAWVWPAQYPH
eukprot:118597-Chlamydomonas_euryale.AAC.1